MFQEILIHLSINSYMKKIIILILFNICFFETYQYSGSIGSCYGFNSSNSIRNQFSVSSLSENKNSGILFVYQNINSTTTIPGDVNGDTIVNILDIVLVISLILGNQYDYAADVNSDNIVNVLDIVMIVNIILN